MNANNTFEYKFIVGEMQGQLVDRASDLINLVVEQKFDTLVFLDRSARPAAWIFEAFWSSKFPDTPLTPFIFICTGKKKNLKVSEEVLGQIEMELGTHAQENLSGKKVLIVDDIEKNGIQRKFVEEVLEKLYQPSLIEYFEWNKLGGMRLPHGLSYIDNGSFIARPDSELADKVKQIKKEIEELSKGL